jgi:hypothetical protein
MKDNVERPLINIVTIYPGEISPVIYQAFLLLYKLVICPYNFKSAFFPEKEMIYWSTRENNYLLAHLQ